MVSYEQNPCSEEGTNEASGTLDAVSEASFRRLKEPYCITVSCNILCCRGNEGYEHQYDYQLKICLQAKHTSHYNHKGIEDFRQKDPSFKASCAFRGTVYKRCPEKLEYPG